MASTRNNNTPSDYCLQQKSYSLTRNYTAYSHSSYGAPNEIAMPCLGITPSHMSYDAFSNNGIAIESALFGINSSNLVNPREPITPQLKPIKFKPFFSRVPMIMPDPLIIEGNHRPFPI
jgi:hypothetical protein